MRIILIIVMILALLGGAMLVGIYAAEYYNMYFKTLLYISFGMVGLTILAGYVDYKKKTKWFYVVSTLTVLLLVSVLTSKLAKTNDFSQNQIIARELVKDLNSYKKENGSYPQNIMDATNEFNTSVFKYRCSEDSTFFILSYSMDGWHFKEYDSRTKQWFVKD